MKNEQMNLNEIKFELNLKSRTKKSRQEEAIFKLKQIYPFEINTNSIYIEETEKKDYFNVYINHDKKNTHNKKIVIHSLLLAIIFISLLCAILVSQHLSKLHKAEIAVQRKIELEQKERIKKENENLQKLQELELQWLTISHNKYEKIYPHIQLLYSLVGKDSFIESLVIENDSFTMEIRTTDSISLLSRFEHSYGVFEVKLSRTTIVDKKDLINLSGKFNRNILLADKSLTTEQQIDFYEKLLDENERITNAKQSRDLSDYVGEVRNLLHKNSCMEQYLVLKGEKDNLELEILCYSSSKDILNFINLVQQSQNIYDIKKLKIQVSEFANRTLTELCFKTGIVLTSEKTDLKYLDSLTDISVKDISQSFYKPTVNRNATSITQTQKQPESKVQKTLQKLSYIGYTKASGIEFYIVKNEEFGNVIKLEKTDSESDHDCIYEQNGKLIAKIKNNYYEVIK